LDDTAQCSGGWWTRELLKLQLVSKANQVGWSPDSHPIHTGRAGAKRNWPGKGINQEDRRTVTARSPPAPPWVPRSEAPARPPGRAPGCEPCGLTWCMIATGCGHSPEATAARLMEVSPKAQENGEGYALLTATNTAVGRRAPARKIDARPRNPAPAVRKDGRPTTALRRACLRTSALAIN
jgi:hypothetical protein